MFSLPKLLIKSSHSKSPVYRHKMLLKTEGKHRGHSHAAMSCSTPLPNWIMLYLEHTNTVWDSCPYHVGEIPLSEALLWTSHSFEWVAPPYQLHLIFYMLWDLPQGCPRCTSNCHHPENCSCSVHVVVWYKQRGDPIKRSDLQYEWLGWLWHQDNYHSASLLINTVQHIQNNIKLLQSYNHPPFIIFLS